jgi:DNA-binding CsgD family transcriptional regulator
MTKENRITARNQRMLELLAEGASSRVIAQRMGYQEGTTRVYLHNMYRTLGVANKTEAVVWYLGRQGGGKPAAPPAPGLGNSRELLGNCAIEEGLYACLGVMSRLVGPFGHIWEVGQRMAGTEPDERTLNRKQRARELWRALLQGDYAFAKRLYDVDEGTGLVLDSASDAVLLASLLLMGGYSLAGDRLSGRINDKRRAGARASAKEGQLLDALRDALNDKDARALGVLGRIAADPANAPLRQLATALVFQVSRVRGDLARARQAAEALWAEADAARKQLEAMGERPLPAAAGHGSTKTAREKAAVVR